MSQSRCIGREKVIPADRRARKEYKGPSKGTEKAKSAAMEGRYNPQSPICLSCSVVVILLVVALPLFGYFSYTILWEREDETFRELLDTLSDDVFIEIEESLGRIEAGAALMADYTGTFSNSWPNASISYYGIMNDRTAELSKIAFALLPIVLPHQVAGFEEHSKTVFANTPNVPSNAGENEFGFGVYREIDGSRVHDTTGETEFSRYNFLTPLLYSGFPDTSNAYLFNLHSTDFRAEGSI